MKTFVIGLLLFGLGVFLATHEAEYTITDYSEWCSYLEGEDVGDRHSAWWEFRTSLSVDQPKLQASFLEAYTHWVERQYVVRGHQFAWVEDGDVLHLTNPANFTGKDQSAFAQRVHLALQNTHDVKGEVEGDCLWATISLLFKSVVIHNSIYDIASGGYKTNTTRLNVTGFKKVFRSSNTMLLRGQEIL